MKKNKSKRVSTKISIIAKCSLPILLIIFMLCIVIVGKINLKTITGNVYSISELAKSIDTISQGDKIDYELNGYNDWEVLYVDKENGTVDVVSKTNTEDVKLEPGKDVKSIIDKLEETANKYVDDNHAISARIINKSDLEYLSYDTEFWLNNIDSDYILTSKSYWKWNNNELYVIPMIEIERNAYYTYNIGDRYETEIEGIKDWIIIDFYDSYYNSTMYLIPATPIKLELVEGNQDIGTNIEEQMNDLYRRISDGINYQYFYFTSPDERIVELYKNYLDSTEEAKMFITGSGNFDVSEYRENEIYYTDNVYTYSKKSGLVELESNSTIYSGPATIGFRPVVTLKVDTNVDKKELNDKLRVGDNVNYSAKDYNNWKVLSIDKDSNTVDVISGGIVKNITYYGTADFEKIEKLLQTEADAYKNENAISARVIDNYDIDNLNKMRDKVINQYWTGVKKKVLKDDICENSHEICKQKSLLAETLFYSNGEIISYWAPLFSEIGVSTDDSLYYDEYSGTLNGDKSYTAGLRPIITLKLDEVEKLDPEEVKTIERETISREKVIVIEQRNKNNITDKNINSSTKEIDNNAISKIEPTTESQSVTCNCCEQKEKIRPVDYIIITLILLNAVLTTIAIIAKKKEKKNQ